MQKYKFSNPLSVVEVFQSPLDKPERGNPYTLYDCLCRGFGHNNKSPRKTYKICAPSPGAAARTAMEFYRKDFFSDGTNRT